MVARAVRADAVPFGWVEVSNSALQRLRREMEQKGHGVVDEMGVLAIHSGYADYFFPGTSVLQTRPRYLFFVCWNFLWLAKQRGVTAANLTKRKDEAELWVTSQLAETSRRPVSPATSKPNMDGIIGIRVFTEDPTRVPAQTLDFIYWTALRRWGFYRSPIAQDRTRLFRRWRGASVSRVGEGLDESQDDVIREESLAEFQVPAAPEEWRADDYGGLDFELTGIEARWLQERLVGLGEVAEGPCLLAKAAELCADSPPRMAPGEDSPLRPWDDPLAIRAAKAAGQLARLERACQASHLAHYVRAVYAALVEWVVEATPLPRRNPPLRHYRQLLTKLTTHRAMREAALALPLSSLYSDVSRIPELLRQCLHHTQEGLRRVEKGEGAEAAFMDVRTHRLFELVERRRKGARARLPRTDQGAARRIGFDERTLSVYDLDYRWNRVRYILWDLHRGLSQS